MEEKVVSWEIQGYLNEYGDSTDQYGGQQFLQVLAVVVRKLKTKHHKARGFCVVGTAARQHQQAMNQNL